jgi:hypothetical protein
MSSFGRCSRLVAVGAAIVSLAARLQENQRRLTNIVKLKAIVRRRLVTDE